MSVYKHRSRRIQICISVVQYIGIEDRYDYDFDFNDIVVDIIQNTTEKHRRTYKVDADGEKTELARIK